MYDFTQKLLLLVIFFSLRPQAAQPKKVTTGQSEDCLFILNRSNYPCSICLHRASFYVLKLLVTTVIGRKEMTMKHWLFL